VRAGSATFGLPISHPRRLWHDLADGGSLRARNGQWDADAVVCLLGRRVRQLIFGAAVAAAILALACSATAQISPGPLSKAHQSLSGATQCTSCHRVAAGAASFKCLECHTDISGRVAQKRGLHASFGTLSPGGRDCVRCHSEHNGEDFAIIRWDPSPVRFDHSKTGYVLEGKHAGVACARCHIAAHISIPERRLISVKDLNRTFLGVSRACATCHDDKHQGRLGQNCARCHGFKEWKAVALPAPAEFDHSQTRFPLTGLHARVACQKCHLPGGDARPRYIGLAFNRCLDCHNDPHRGTFAGTCETCHNTRGWRSVSAVAVNQRFDHSKTKYPLLGKHTEVACGQCHLNGDFKRPIAFDKCAGCHTPDPHGGQFLARADRGECASCHTVEGFRPAKFGIKEHEASAYPLRGKHVAVACAQCHIPAGKATLYKVKFARCTDCHKDGHDAQFAAAPYFNQCERCHDLNGYRPSTFSLAQHKQTRFQLTGGHIATPCGDCHKAPDGVQLATAVRYRFDDRSCTVCHQDPHRGQFKNQMLKIGSSGSQAGCEACHTTGSWSDLKRFDHGSTRFPLLGAHRATACIDCHKPPNLETRLRNVDFRAAARECEECHQDVHAAQFLKTQKTRSCASCHNSTKWKPSLFDHETRTSFSLQGAHKNVRCGACHKNAISVQDKLVLLYKPTPTLCIDCHGPAFTTKTSTRN